MTYIIEVESISGNVQKLGGIFPTTEDATDVAERLWNRVSGDGNVARVSILDKKTKEVYADYEC